MESVSIRRMSRAHKSGNDHGQASVSATVNRRRIVSEPGDSLQQQHHLLAEDFEDVHLPVVNGSFFCPVVESSSETGSQYVPMNLPEGGNGDANLTTTNHGGSIDFECEQCGKNFATKTQLNRHAKTHLGDLDGEKPLKSRKDSEPSVSPPSALTPSKRSHREGEKRFQCLQCSKRFPTSKDLKRHDVVHTGNREFQCSFCSHRFGRKDHRMRHEKKTHAAELQLQQQRQQQPSPKQLSPPPSIPVAPAAPPAPPQSLSKPPPLLPISMSPPAAASFPAKSRLRSSGQRWRHMSSPSTFRHPPSPGGPGFLAEINMEGKAAGEESGGAVDRVIASEASDIVKGEEQEVPDGAQPIVAMMHDRSFGVLRIASTEAGGQGSEMEDVGMNGDLDSLLSDMMSDSPVAGAVISGMEQETYRKDEVSSLASSSSSSFTAAAPSFGVPASAVDSRYQEGLMSKSRMIPGVPGVAAEMATKAMTLEGNPMMTSVASSAPSTSNGFKTPPQKLMSDMLTRTKNPVLPSVYIDNSLIVPEPAKQKYHSPHHSLLFESDFMDIDSFLL